MAGGIVIFAAGNDTSDEICYPASDKSVISVAATSWLGTPSYFTNYGKWVSISAPGGDLSLNSTYGGVYSTSVSEDGGSAYEGINGTSMACPHVRRQVFVVVFDTLVDHGYDDIGISCA